MGTPALTRDDYAYDTAHGAAKKSNRSAMRCGCCASVRPRDGGVSGLTLRTGGAPVWICCERCRLTWTAHGDRRVTG